MIDRTSILLVIRCQY